MKKGIFLYSATILLALNFFAWQEVFALGKLQTLKVNFLSVGQGDSEFIETPENYHILIDGGPDSTVLEKLNSFLPFWSKSIDVVILTHPEKDHMTGILDVLQRYNVKYFLWNGIVKNDAENKKLAVLLNNSQKLKTSFLAKLSGQEPTKIIVVSAGQELRAGKVKIDFLYPFENFAGKEVKNSSNDTCIVARLVYGKDSFIFTGDIDTKAEKALVNSNKDIASDVLKIAHHGSKYSTSDLFLAAVRPEVAVIEVGKNSYGHPTQEVLKRLENSGIQIKRTDQNGDVQIVSDGNKIKIK